MNQKRVICPCCGSKCIQREWYEEVGLVETDIQCKCGYHYSDSYGRVEINLPNHHFYTYSCDTPDDEIEQIDEVVNKEILKLKKDMNQSPILLKGD